MAGGFIGGPVGRRLGRSERRRRILHAGRGAAGARAQALGDGRIAQSQTQLALQALVGEPARLAQEAHLHRREARLGFGAADARRPRQAGQVGGEVEVVAHLQLAVVDDVDDALRPAAVQRGDAGARQVVGMDVVGVDVVVGREHRFAAAEALARVAAAPTRARRCRESRRTVTATPEARPNRRRRRSASTRRRARSVRGCAAPGLVDARAAAVAIDAARRRVDEAAHALRALRAPQAGAPLRGSALPAAGGGARWSTASARSARRASVAAASRSPSSGSDARGAQLGAPLGRRRQGEDAPAAAQQPGDAQADVAAADDEQHRPAKALRSIGHVVVVPGRPVGPRAASFPSAGKIAV